MEDMLVLLSALWPVFIGFITLVWALSKMYYSIEVLKEKVKTLFDIVNKD
tara:strand:- start:347 stop:496 length:150 start_codon:yes stop_codon:yes gene_type:complete